jgi:hypothetical protein
VSAAQVTETQVRAAFDEARAAVQQAGQRKALDPVPPLTFTTAAELGKCVAAENLPLVRLRQSDPEKAAREADQLGMGFAQLAYAKYSWSTKKFLVVLESWNQQARLMDDLEFTEDEAVRAVLVHELVHALDDASYDLSACTLRCPSADAVTGFNAVLEGHAQHVARAVCAHAGWSDGFDTFTGHIGAVPSTGVDEGLRQYLRIQSATILSAYGDGERFVAALDEHGGAELVGRAFATPPDAETIFHPDWFIDPSTRPVSRYDPEPALDLLAARFPADAWTATRVALTPAQVSAGPRSCRRRRCAGDGVAARRARDRPATERRSELEARPRRASSSTRRSRPATWPRRAGQRHQGRAHEAGLDPHPLSSHESPTADLRPALPQAHAQRPAQFDVLSIRTPARAP